MCRTCGSEDVEAAVEPDMDTVRAARARGPGAPDGDDSDSASEDDPERASEDDPDDESDDESDGASDDESDGASEDDPDSASEDDPERASDGASDDEPEDSSESYCGARARVGLRAAAVLRLGCLFLCMSFVV
jgi:hypothetical protein